jgi:hypothetical protein
MGETALSLIRFLCAKREKKKYFSAKRKFTEFSRATGSQSPVTLASQPLNKNN